MAMPGPSKALALSGCSHLPRGTPFTSMMKASMKSLSAMIAAFAAISGFMR